MFKRILLSAVVLWLLVASSPSIAGPFDHEWLHVICIPECIRRRCCDDYCPKPQPCATGVKRFCCDDYCEKPMPCPMGVKCFCCDDYCSKPFPRVLCPPCTDLKCSPPVCGHQTVVTPAIPQTVAE